MTEPTASASQNEPQPDGPEDPPPRPTPQFDPVFNHRDPSDVEYRGRG
jgi:hypothetical protein